MSLHIKVGAGLRERTGNVEAARRNRDPTPGPTVAPWTRALGVVSASCFAAFLLFARARANSWVLIATAEGALSGRGVRSRGAAAPAARTHGHGPARSAPPSSRPLQRSAICAPSGPRPPTEPAPTGGSHVVASGCALAPPTTLQAPPQAAQVPPHASSALSWNVFPGSALLRRRGQRLKVANYWPLG